jgi:type VI secretion system lysozyme-like protein
MPEIVLASRQPLFDRFAGDDPVALDGALLDAPGLQVSLLRELQRIFDTRCGVPLDEYLQRPLTVLDYGLPDVSTLSIHDEADRLRLAAVIGRALAAFEPRLSRVQVKVEAALGARERVVVHLSAAVRLGPELRRVDFRAAADASERLTVGGAATPNQD